MRPSHTTRAIAELLENYGELWYVIALNQQWFEKALPPPMPSAEIQRDKQGIMVYDVFARGHYSRMTLEIRLSYEDALNAGKALAVEEKGILLSYDETQDALHWIRPEQDATGPNEHGVRL